MCFCAVQVHKQAKAYLLLREWMTERSRHGYSVTGAHEIDGGKYSWVMMSNKGMPITQQTYMVRTLELFSRTPLPYITALSSFIIDFCVV